MNRRQPSVIQNNLYSRSEMTEHVLLPITDIGKNLQQRLEETIQLNLEGKCSSKGYIKPGSCKIKTYSSGLVQKGNFVSFEVIFECSLCFPVEGMIISCVAKNITIAGISGTNSDAGDIYSPIYVFVPKDYHKTKNNEYFNQIKIGDVFTIKVIGIQFELGDKQISILGELYI
jgi:DNA-directed RNA polymerase subunit E'/Rpb7